MSDDRTKNTTNSRAKVETKSPVIRELDKTLDLAYGSSFQDALHEIASQIRHLIGAHQSAVSFVPDGDFKRAIHTHSFSDKYEKYNDYDVMPTGKGLWGCIAEQKVSMRLSEKEIASHPRFNNFSNLKTESGLEHPPMPGWLAVPVIRPNGDFIGVLQLSDRYSGDFTEADQIELERLAKVVGLTFELHYVNSNLVTAKEDFSELKNAELLLSQERERFELAVNSANIGIWEWDLLSDELVWNDNMHKIYQTPNHIIEDGMFYNFWEESVHSDDLEQATSSLQQAIKNKERWSSMFRLKLLDGTNKHIRATAIVRLDENDNPIKLTGVNIDVTEQQNLERNLAKAVEAETRANRSKSEFLANMSHEIRTPMNAIMGLTQVLLGLSTDEKVNNYISKINQSSRALLNVLNDILDYSKIESDKLDLISESFCLDEVFENLIGLFSLMAEQKGLELIIDDKSSVRHFIGDPLRIGQVFNNIVGNAIKFTDSGHIVIRVADEQITPEEFRLKCSIEDTGIGMSEEQVKKLFRPFTQADATIARKYEGTGLGLTISQKLLALMNGEICVESELGNGSHFHFYITLRPDNAKVVHKKHFSDLRALVVDDNPESLSILDSTLTSWGISVDSYQSSLEAYKHLKETTLQYDVLLVDWLMPEINGLELLSRLDKKIPNHKFVVIMVTAYEKEKLLEAKEAKINIDAVVEKPILASLLYEKLITLLDLETGIEDYPPAKAGIESNTSCFAGKKVLLVEDNDVNQLVASEFLAKLNIQFDVVENGQDAVTKVAQNDYDLILMDIQMPVMDGYESSKRIRALEEGKSIPILAMTAAALENDKAAALAAGMNDHVAKPFDFVELEQKLAVWLDKSHLAGEEVENKNESTKKQRLHVDGFDLELAVSRFSDDWGLLEKLLERFTVSLKNLNTEIVESIETENIQQLKAALHTMRGSAASVGAMTLAKIASELEQQVELVTETFPNCKGILAQLSKAKAALKRADIGKSTDIGNVHSPKNAEKELSELLGKMKSGGFINSSERLLFLEEVQKLLGAKTAKKYKKQIDKLQFKIAADSLESEMQKLRAK